MRLKDLRSEFDVLIVEPVVNTSENYVKILAMAGYKCRECSNTIEAISLIRDEPPHIIFLSLSDLDSSRQQIEALSSISSEIQIVLLTSKQQLQRALKLVEQELIYDFLTLPLSSPNELVLKADKASEKLYLTFQLEEAQLNHAAKLYQTPEDEEYSAPPLIQIGPSSSDKNILHKFEDAILKLSMSRDPGQALATFLQLTSDYLSSSPVTYFKFLPTHFSFVFAECVGVQAPARKNVGIDLRKSGLRDSSEVFSQIEKIDSINQLFASVFKSPKFTIIPHAVDGEPLGFFAVLSELNKEEKDQLRILERLFSVVYQRNLLEKAKEQFETRDPLTGLTSVANFEAKLKEELSRSRRTGLAFSLVVVEIDNLLDLEDRIGINNTDTILKMISVIVRKTSRNNDIAGSLARGRFALILPHTDVAGAKVRGERLQKMITSTKFPMTENEQAGTLSSSVAVGEYPTLSSDAESLVRSTLSALQAAQDSGGGRLTVVQVSPDFKPDFRPHPVQSPSNLDRSRGTSK